MALFFFYFKLCQFAEQTIKGLFHSSFLSSNGMKFIFQFKIHLNLWKQSELYNKATYIFLLFYT